MSSIGGVTVKVHGATPFLYESVVTRSRLIGDGLTISNNEVIQGSALPNRSATVNMRVFTEDDLESVEAMQAAQFPVTYVDRRGRSRQVVVEKIDGVELDWFWEVQLSLIETSAPIGAELSS